jgi:cellulose biosynthesis protein BcsQ
MMSKRIEHPKTEVRVESEDCRVGRILENPELIASLFDLPTPLGQNAANVSLLSADETLDEIENGLMLKSTFNKQQGGDVRLRLCRFLRSETIESRFDLVVIDTPPRFSAAAVNGLLAATHILVPTKMEDSSIGATLKFCDRLKKLQQTGYPAANFLGVVPVMTQARPHLTRSEIEACNLADDRLADIFGPKNLVIRDGWVPDTRAIGGAAQAGIAYMQDSTARAIFDDLGAAIQKRMG